VARLTVISGRCPGGKASLRHRLLSAAGGYTLPDHRYPETAWRAFAVVMEKVYSENGGLNGRKLVQSSIFRELQNYAKYLFASASEARVLASRIFPFSIMRCTTSSGIGSMLMNSSASPGRGQGAGLWPGKHA